MPIPGSPPERLAPLIRLVGIDIVPLEQHPHDPLIPIPSPLERCLAPLICPVGIDIIPLEEYPHNPLMLSPGSPGYRCAVVGGSGVRTGRSVTTATDFLDVLRDRQVELAYFGNVLP